MAGGSENPDWPLNGLLEFIDPRSGAEAVTAPGDPYGEPFRIRPQSGLLVIFPSWLYHWVHPYAGSTPRIAVSFNASEEACTADQTSVEDRTFSSVTSNASQKTPVEFIQTAAISEDFTSHVVKV